MGFSAEHQRFCKCQILEWQFLSISHTLLFYHSKMGTILLPMEQQAPTEVFEAPNEIPNKDFQILIL
jgi:hypothetical protein